MPTIKQFNQGRTMIKGRKTTPITVDSIKRQQGVKPRVIKNGTGRPTGKGFKVR